MLVPPESQKSMKSNTLPILYSFRRCPYAMRARLAISSAGIDCEHREVVLRDKPAELIEASPKGTVPVVILGDGRVLDESLDIMKWALELNDPEHLINLTVDQSGQTDDWIHRNDTTFKAALDRYKYPEKFESEAAKHRASASVFLCELDAQLEGHAWLLGEAPTLADLAILPFVRQFAHVDREWFWAEPWPYLVKWLDNFLASERFKKIMIKHPQWVSERP